MLLSSHWLPWKASKLLLLQVCELAEWIREARERESGGFEPKGRAWNALEPCHVLGFDLMLKSQQNQARCSHWLLVLLTIKLSLELGKGCRINKGEKAADEGVGRSHG